MGVFLCASALWGQGAVGTLNGTVFDPSGSVVAGAKVTAKHVATAVEHEATATSAGYYTMPYLPAGTYSVSVSAAGFSTATAENVILRIAQTLTVDITLKVGQVTEQVTVSTEAPLLESSNAEIGRYISAADYSRWPNRVSDGQRQLQGFIFASLPGAVGGTFQGSINGGQYYSHEILIEGMPVGRMDLQGGNLDENTPSADAVSEFKLQTGVVGAQYTGGQTAVANFGIKSGTNEIHGTGYIFLQNDALQANSFANNSRGVRKAPLRDTSWGYTVGGPVYLPKVYNGKNKSFFFTSLEDDRRRSYGISGYDTRLPTVDFKRGDFSRLFNPAFTEVAASGSTIATDANGRPVRYGQIYDPRSTARVGTAIVRTPFDGNIIPRTQWSPVARNVIDNVGITDPELDRMLRNTPTLSSGSPEFDLRSYAFKGDHHFSQRHHASGYFNYIERARYNSIGGRWPPLPGPPTGVMQWQVVDGRTARLSEDWTISPTLLNRIALGFNRFGNSNNSYYLNQDWPQKIGLQNVPGTHFPRFNFGAGRPEQGAGIGAGGNLGSNTRGFGANGSWILQDDVTIIRRAHSIRVGFEHRKYYYNSRPISGSGDFVFSPVATHQPGFSNQTGHSFASFLLGAASSASRGVSLTSTGFRWTQTGFYIMDDWKVKPRLTFNMGLRWEIIGGFYEILDRMSIVDPAKPNPAANNRPGAFAFIDELGRNSFQDRYWKMFGPRFGFAYKATDKMVFRGGYSLMNMPPIAYGFGFGFATNGFNGSINIPGGTSTTGFADDPSFYLHNRFPDLTATLPNKDPGQLLFTGQSVVSRDSNRLPYAQNWDLTFQYQLPRQTVLEVAYVGNKGSRLPDDGHASLNQLPASAFGLGETLLAQVGARPEFRPYATFPNNQTVAQALRPFPQYTGLNEAFMFSGNSLYNSLQVTLTRHFSKGFSILTAYTFSKAIATTDDALDGSAAQDVYNRSLDRSVTGYHIPHFLKVTWIYDLPFGPGKTFLNRGGVLGKIVGGWAFTGIHQYRTGSPISIGQGGVRNLIFAPGIRPDVTGGNQKLATPSNADFVNGTPYLDRAGFAQSPITPDGIARRFGTAPRFLPNVRGFHSFGEDLGLTKNIPVYESVNMKFSAGIFNPFNRGNRGGPNTDITSPQFGRVFGGGGGRTIQIEGRVEW